MSETGARHSADATPAEPVPPATSDEAASSSTGSGKHVLGDTDTHTDTAATEGPAYEIEHQDDPDSEGDPEEDPGPEPSWWHRSHPTFSALMGFFAGIAFVIIVPSVYGGILSATVSEKRAEALFPWILAALLVPIAMLVPRRTRHFATFMLVGIVATLLVVAITAGLVLWFLVQHDK